MPRSHHVIGPPGCGKTHFIAQDAARAVGSYGESKVAVCSLTRAAASELSGRVGLGRDQTGTVHSFCYRNLGLGDSEIVEDSKDFIDAWNREYPREDWWLKYGKLEKNDYMAAFSESRMRMSRPLTTQQQNFADHYTRFKREFGAIDFTDMLEMGLENLERMPGNPSAIYIDEAQDMSILEAALLRQWARHAEELTIVGDPYQNLYEFRGSDAGAMLPTHNIIDNATILNQSYRVPRKVHELAMKVIRMHPNYIPVDYLPTAHEGYVKMGHKDLDIGQHIDRGESVMILASCNYMLSDACDALKAAGIPFHNQYSQKDGQFNPLRKGGLHEKLGRFMQEEITPESILFWSKGMPVSKVWKPRRGSYARGQLEFIQQFAQDKDPADVEGEVYELLQAEMLPEALTALADMDTDWFLGQHPVGKTEYLRNIMRRRSLAEASDPLVTVGTIHSVKGGEADHVYVYPDMSHQMAEAAWQGPIGQHVRQWYVAVTRARKGVNWMLPRSGLEFEIE